MKKIKKPISINFTVLQWRGIKTASHNYSSLIYHRLTSDVTCRNGNRTPVQSLAERSPLLYDRVSMNRCKVRQCSPTHFFSVSYDMQPPRYASHHLKEIKSDVPPSFDLDTLNSHHHPTYEVMLLVPK